MMMNLKRKGVDQVSEDFSDFSLSPPATKIRRLDVELPPIEEEEEEEDDEPSLLLPEEDQQKERALVLFKPLLHSPSSLTLHSDFISGFKNQLPWSKQSDSDCDRIMRSAEEEQPDNNNHGLALVPWVPSPQFPPPPPPPHDLMDAEEASSSSSSSSSMMDIEPDISNSCSTNHSTTLHQWHQQHCLLPQLPQNTSTPITWTRSSHLKV